MDGNCVSLSPTCDFFHSVVLLTRALDALCVVRGTLLPDLSRALAGFVLRADGPERAPHGIRCVTDPPFRRAPTRLSDPHSPSFPASYQPCLLFSIQSAPVHPIEFLFGPPMSGTT